MPKGIKRAVNEKGELRCSGCEKWKPTSAFHERSDGGHGFSSHCKKCRKRAEERRKTERAASEPMEGRAFSDAALHEAWGRERDDALLARISEAAGAAPHRVTYSPQGYRHGT